MEYSIGNGQEGEQLSWQRKENWSKSEAQIARERREAKIQSELNKVPKEFPFLEMVENSLILEPLFNHPEWFDTSNPVTITKEMLEKEYPGNNKLIDRFIERSGVVDVKGNSNDVINPFRSNVLANILTPSLGLYRGDERSKGIYDQAKSGDLLENEMDTVKDITLDLIKRIAHRKNVGITLRNINEDIAAEKSKSFQNKEQIAELEELKKQVEESAQTTADEASHVYAIGRLTDAIVRKYLGRENVFGEASEALQTIKQPLPQFEETDFGTQLDEIRSKYGDLVI